MTHLLLAGGDLAPRNRDVLSEAVKIQSPWQKISEDLLGKVNAARAKGK